MRSRSSRAAVRPKASRSASVASSFESDTSFATRGPAAPTSTAPTPAGARWSYPAFVDTKEEATMPLKGGPHAAQGTKEVLAGVQGENRRAGRHLGQVDRRSV